MFGRHAGRTRPKGVVVYDEPSSTAGVHIPGAPVAQVGDLAIIFAGASGYDSSAIPIRSTMASAGWKTPDWDIGAEEGNVEGGAYTKATVFYKILGASDLGDYKIPFGPSNNVAIRAGYLNIISGPFSDVTAGAIGGFGESIATSDASADSVGYSASASMAWQISFMTHYSNVNVNSLTHPSSVTANVQCDVIRSVGYQAVRAKIMKPGDVVIYTQRQNISNAYGGILSYSVIQPS